MIKRNGFSLIELIVVITIIMVVTSIGTISYISASKGARDSRRKSDLEKVRVALEIYRQQVGTYPAADSGNAIPSALTAGYLQSIPADPKGYSYAYVRPTVYTYSLYSYLETGTGSFGVSCGASNCNYKVDNP